MNYIIRKAKTQDKDFLLKLRIITMQEYLEEAGIFLDKKDHIARVESHFDCSNIIENNSGGQIGLLKYIEKEKSVEIIQFQILPEFQDQGIGSSIIESMFSKTSKLEKKLTLKVFKNNPALRLYKRMGFTIVGEDDIEFHMEV